MEKDMNNYYMSSVDKLEDYQWQRLETCWQVEEAMGELKTELFSEFD